MDSKIAGIRLTHSNMAYDVGVELSHPCFLRAVGDETPEIVGATGIAFLLMYAVKQRDTFVNVFLSTNSNHQRDVGDREG